MPTHYIQIDILEFNMVNQIHQSSEKFEARQFMLVKVHSKEKSVQISNKNK